MPYLVAPTLRLRSSWRDAYEEWGPGTHEDGFGLLPEDEVRSSAGFSAWLDRLTEESNPASQLGEGRVHCTYRWITEDDQVLGGIALRHELNDDLSAGGGQVGYGIRPSARCRGLATWALGQMLVEARTLDLERVLAVCAVENIAFGEDHRALWGRPGERSSDRARIGAKVLDQDLTETDGE
jgi:predicted acetyltransferase